MNPHFRQISLVEIDRPQRVTGLSVVRLNFQRGAKVSRGFFPVFLLGGEPIQVVMSRKIPWEHRQQMVVLLAGPRKVTFLQPDFPQHLLRRPGEVLGGIALSIPDGQGGLKFPARQPSVRRARELERRASTLPDQRHRRRCWQ